MLPPVDPSEVTPMNLVLCFPESAGAARRAPRAAAAGVCPRVRGEPGGDIRVPARRPRALARLWYGGQALCFFTSCFCHSDSLFKTGHFPS